MCNCDGFAQRRNFDSLRDYCAIVRQLIELVARGRFMLVKASCPLEDMLGTPLPGDVIFHDFQCVDCRRCFISLQTHTTAMLVGVLSRSKQSRLESQPPNFAWNSAAII
jgi:hypothetical protein